VLGYNRQNINDLQVTSPHGRDFTDYAENLGFTFDAEAIRGTVMAHRDGVNPWVETNYVGTPAVASFSEPFH
jgi:hypothetical protein